MRQLLSALKKGLAMVSLVLCFVAVVSVSFAEMSGQDQAYTADLDGDGIMESVIVNKEDEAVLRESIQNGENKCRPANGEARSEKDGTEQANVNE